MGRQLDRYREDACAGLSDVLILVETEATRPRGDVSAYLAALKYEIDERPTKT
jgi:hypothetical protein